MVDMRFILPLEKPFRNTVLITDVTEKDKFLVIRSEETSFFTDFKSKRLVYDLSPIVLETMKILVL